MENKIREWLNSAERDIRDAEILFRNKSYKNCALHCHQAIEKILKSIIVQKEYRLVRSHDLIRLTEDAKLSLPQDIMDCIDRINPHYLPAKYPDVAFKFNYSKISVRRILSEAKGVFKWLKLELSHKT